MGLDIRLPIGGMFAVTGLLVAVYGVMTAGDARMYERATGVNINLWWGLAMLAFGLVMLALGRLGAKSGGARPAAESREGRATEEREHRLGLERED
jgi:membrane-bound ClpP family serine protease